MNFLTREHENLRAKTRDFAEEHLRPIADEVDESSEVSASVVRLLAKHGFFRMLIPEEYGGSGIKVLSLAIVREELARVCSAADMLMACQGFGSYPIIVAGTKEQKSKYLPPVATGERLTTSAMTEPEAGSDFAAIKTTALPEKGFYVFNGDKVFISHGNAAHFLTVFAKTDLALRAEGISAFIVEKETPGFHTEGMNLMIAHDIARLKFKDCRVPKENLLGQLGGGMYIAMSLVDVFRTLLGASSVGIAKAALELAIDYAQKRIAFGRPISKFQAIQFKLADMATEIDAAMLLVYRAAALKDNGAANITKEASMAKLFGTEMAKRVVDESLQIHGGWGVVKGNPVERLYREARLATIGEATSEIQRLVIGREVLKGGISPRGCALMTEG
jgi:alkylation response protein AidB-like acyl-CoA dehydrogenase